ncbi:hypothetical protein VCHC43B1_1584 [Vibrio cholerae HC-43B1]|nr:hypothetical protein VCHC43B1_1584 [Vibrio cholerae HC-43B1]
MDHQFCRGIDKVALEQMPTPNTTLRISNRDMQMAMLVR